MTDKEPGVKESMVCDCYKCELKDLFYRNITDIALDSICERKFETIFRKGESIISEGDEILHFSYLKSGLAKIFRLSQNKEQIIAITRPMDFIGILGILTSKTYNYSVMALEDSVTCNMDIELVRNICQTNNNFTFSLFEKVSHIYDKIVIEGIKIRQKHLRGRVSYILLMFANEIYFSNKFELPLTRKEIAEFIGMTTENVIRVFSEFRKDGLIRISGKTIEILDKNRMDNISNFG